MTDLEARLADLEVRYAHQDAAIEALTKTVVKQGKTIDQLTSELAAMARLLREASPGAVRPEELETPPPHY